MYKAGQATLLQGETRWSDFFMGKQGGQVNYGLQIQAQQRGECNATSEGSQVCNTKISEICPAVDVDQQPTTVVWYQKRWSVVSICDVPGHDRPMTEGSRRHGEHKSTF